MIFFFRELETGETDLTQLNPSPSVLDVASLLKQFLRSVKYFCAPVSLILVPVLVENVTSVLE
jgi:hypothetical protein